MYRALPCGKSQQKHKKRRKKRGRKEQRRQESQEVSGASKAKLPECKLALSARTLGTPFQMSPATWRAARVSQS